MYTEVLSLEERKPHHNSLHMLEYNTHTTVQHGRMIDSQRCNNKVGTRTREVEAQAGDTVPPVCVSCVCLLCVSPVCVSRVCLLCVMWAFIVPLQRTKSRRYPPRRPLWNLTIPGQCACMYLATNRRVRAGLHVVWVCSRNEEGSAGVGTRSMGPGVGTRSVGSGADQVTTP